MDDEIATFLEFYFTELEGGISTVRTAGDSDFLPREGYLPRLSLGFADASPRGRSLTLPREKKGCCLPRYEKAILRISRIWCNEYGFLHRI